MKHTCQFLTEYIIAAVLITRVYKLAAPVFHMGIEEHLNKKMCCHVVHLEHLHAGYINVSNDYKDLYWPFGKHILTGLNIIRENPIFTRYTSRTMAVGRTLLSSII